jgi:hypothetical protein
LRAAALLLPGFGAQGAAKDSRTTELLLRSTPVAVFPVSRGLLRAKQPESWSDFNMIIGEGCAHWSKELGC